MPMKRVPTYTIPLTWNGDTSWCPQVLCDDKADESQSCNPQQHADNDELIAHLSPLNHVIIFVVEMVPDQFFEEAQLLISVKVSHKNPPQVIKSLPTGDAMNGYKFAMTIL